MQSNSQTTLSNNKPFGFGTGQASSLRSDAPAFTPSSSSVVQPQFKKQAPSAKPQTVLSQPVQPRRDYNNLTAQSNESKQHEKDRQSLQKRTELYSESQNHKFYNKNPRDQSSNQSAIKQKDKEIEELKSQLKLQLQASSNSFFTAPNQSSQTSLLNTFGNLDLDDFEDEGQSMQSVFVQPIVAQPQSTRVALPNQSIVQTVQTVQTVQIDQPAQRVLHPNQQLLDELYKEMNIDGKSDTYYITLTPEKLKQKIQHAKMDAEYMKSRLLTPSVNTPQRTVSVPQQTVSVPQQKIVNLVSQSTMQPANGVNFNFHSGTTVNIFNVTGPFHLHQGFQN